MSLGFRHIAGLSCALALAACGSSVDADGPDADATGTAGPAAAGADPGAPAGKGGQRSKATQARDRSPSPRNADGSPVELTSTQLCTDVPAETAAKALGLTIDSSEAGTTATPQCTYGYTNAAGNDSTFTLAAMRPADIGGRTGLEAFTYMVDLSKGLAGPVALDEQDLGVGDKATRITGGQVHTAVLAAGGHLLTVTVPEADASASQVDALTGVVARALA